MRKLILIIVLMFTVMAFGQSDQIRVKRLIVSESPWVDVRSYGAKGDGITDDTAAIQAASAATSGGGILYIPSPGVYIITSAITLCDNVEVSGGGADAVLKQTTANTPGMIPASNNYIHGFSMQGVYTTGANSTAIRASYTGISPDVINRDMTDSTKWQGFGMRVADMTLYNWGNNGIWAGPRNFILNNHIYHCYNEGIITFGDHTIIDGNFVTDTESWGIDVNASYSQVTNNRLYDTGSATVFPWDMGGISISTFHTAAGANNNLIQNNVIHTSDGNGILLIDGDNYSAYGNVISGNTLISVAADLSVSNYGAINIQNNDANRMVKHTMVSGNTISSSYGAGIELIAPNDVVVAGNSIDGVVLTPGNGDGIRVELSTPLVATSGSGVVLSSNTITNCPRYGINITDITGVNIIGNMISDLTNASGYLSMIRLVNVGGYSVVGNHLNGVATYYDGILVSGTSVNGIITGNEVGNTHVPIGYSASGGYLTIIGNDVSNSNGFAIGLSGTLTGVRSYWNAGIEDRYLTLKSLSGAAYQLLDSDGLNGFRISNNNDGTTYLQTTVDGFSNADKVPFFIGNAANGRKVGINWAGMSSPPTATLEVNGTISAWNGGSAGKAMCWKADGKTLGYCSTVVSSSGGCTCN